MMLTQAEILTKLTINHDTKKCFIFDLDGTLIFDKSPLDVDTNDILRKIINAGHEVIFATGRPFRDFQTVMPSWTYSGSLILFSGALCMQAEEITSSIYMPDKNVIDLVNMCHSHKLHYNVDNSHNYYHPDLLHSFYEILDATVGTYKARTLDEIFNGSTHKILVLDHTVEEMFREYTDENNLIIKVHSFDKWFDVVPDGVNKFNAVLPYITNYNKDDVFVFGNDFNDFELLLNFANSTLFGDIKPLCEIAAINISYDEYRFDNFKLVINTIIETIE